jgi:hypothetical protein
LLVQSEPGTMLALAWRGFAGTIVTASTFAILQAVDEIAFKMAVDTWYAVAPADDGEEKAIAFRVAEDLRWTKIGIIVSSQFFKAQLK